MNGEPTSEFSYEIKARPANLGGGWRLRLLEGDTEVGGGVFPPDADGKEALDMAYADAMEVASTWLESRDPT